MKKITDKTLSRRQALSILGLTAAAGYIAPTMLNLTPAKAHGHTTHTRSRTLTRSRSRTHTRTRTR